ncbi:CRAL/TRIO domain-containing protein [Colletotrichum scovillei]|uniref:CRAL/TRIO domain-containing protein n=1 Tax=Colletotrichum scovillei TaxID=1209932 RepID=A0A9P7R2U3_9PEZI|nr:CRAL/TRIO domain-containing protein [Colletotrichum scovillei]KAF4773241.1 CRAL/TRIO domain-containing protein [Colletotrichum scovillei]KAG7046831.1 CRAL/TRIO domain-containing protein [Colletotrichum scovillei]KAG7056675.1 CRAL/TRIO domain-containing protein [Colletotrichum scovillei]KAG7066567.1 CRAL/TRIO domain-containing protein [Colletotrichum scovillei]
MPVCLKPQTSALPRIFTFSQSSLQCASGTRLAQLPLTSQFGRQLLVRPCVRKFNCPSKPSNYRRFQPLGSPQSPGLPNLKKPRLLLESRVDIVLCSVAVALACAYGLFYQQITGSKPDPQPDNEIAEPHPSEVMATDIPAGRPGNLTPEQEEKLRQLWNLILSLGEETSTAAADSASASIAPSETSAPGKGDKPKKKRTSLFSRKDKKEGAATSTAIPAGIKEDGEDKYGQTQQFKEALANQSPEALRATIWSMVKHDHPDALALRFLRARKWDVEKAFVMMISTMHWRLTEMKVDDEIMKSGEAGALEAAQNSDPKIKQLGEDFMAQARSGKTFIHGLDKGGRPICQVRVRMHRQGEQCEESLEKYTVFLIETARMVLAPPVDTATIVFDMTGFSRANMDYTPVKFMIKCFEANYPESLGAVLVHKAPWVFQGIWKIIKGWLDPVVAAKVHFTNNVKEMSEFIEPSHILKELDGQEDWDYKYVEPVAGENDKMKDTATRDALLSGREELVHEYEETTLQWIKEAGTDKEAAIKAQREELARRLRDDYWKLDPYLRAKCVLDRTGVIQDGGKIDMYSKGAPAPATPAPAAATPTPASAPAPAPTNGAPAVETSADDVD